MNRCLLDVLAIGELNVDLILNQLDSFPEIGKEKIAGSMVLALGSSTAIFASNLSSLGSKVGFLGKIGKDIFGKFLIDSLIERNVDTSFVIIDENISTGATIALNYGEERAAVTYPGAMEHLTIDDICDEQLLKAKHVHFSSLFYQPGIRKNIGQLFCRAKELQLTTSMDIQWDPAEVWDFDYRAVLPYVDVFFPNETELLHLTNKNSIEDGLETLAPFAQNIALKRGNKGSVLRTVTGMIIERPSYLNPEVVDAIGAGDSFNAGFIHRFVKGDSLIECLDFGNLTGALNTTAAGGTGAFISKEHIENMIKTKFNISISL